MHDEREFEMPRVRRRTSLTVAVEDPRGWDGDGAASSVKSVCVMKLTRRPSLFVVKSSPRVPQRSLFTRWAWLLEPSPPTHNTHTPLVNPPRFCVARWSDGALWTSTSRHEGWDQARRA